MTAPEATYRLEIRRKDFIDGVRTLKPRRVNEVTKLSEFLLGYLDGEAVFCINGAQTRRAAQGVWPGFACFRFAFILAVLKEPPPGPLLEITRSGASIRIGTTRFPARWIDSSEWIAGMALEAHLHGPDEAAVPRELFCPRCGRREGLLLPHLPRRANARPLSPERFPSGASMPGFDPTRECRACGHRWIEMDDWVGGGPCG